MQTVARSIDAPSIDPSLQQLQDAPCAQPRPAGKPPGAPPCPFSPSSLFQRRVQRSSWFVLVVFASPGDARPVRGADRLLPRTLSDIQMAFVWDVCERAGGTSWVVASAVVRGLSGSTVLVIVWSNFGPEWRYEPYTLASGTGVYAKARERGVYSNIGMMGQGWATQSLSRIFNASSQDLVPRAEARKSPYRN